MDQQESFKPENVKPDVLYWGAVALSSLLALLVAVLIVYVTFMGLQGKL